MPALPTMVVIGAMKCATTALHTELARHPDIAMSEPKELNFFNGPERPPHDEADQWWRTGQWHRGLAWYADRFDERKPVRGESSPAYTSPSSPEAAGRMASVLPGARLVCLVRDPVDRAVSQWAHHRRDGAELRPMEEALLDEGSQYLARSRYRERLEPFLDRFPREQVHVAVQERLWRCPAEADQRVTTVVITRDRWPDLRTSLPRHRGPVVLVDNGSGDGTPELVREHFPHVRVVALGRNAGAPARNLGVVLARTPYVAFADDDSWWAAGSLAGAARAFDRHPRLGLLAARIVVGEDERPDPVCALMADSPLPHDLDLPGPSVLGFLACGAVVRREAYLAAGGFDPVIGFAGEEDRLALDLAALGWGLAYVDSVVAHHHPSTTARGRPRLVRAGRNRVLTAVLRRPWPEVGRAVRDQLRSGPTGWSAVLAATRALPRALRLRRPVPEPVEARRRLLDRRLRPEGRPGGPPWWSSSRPGAPARSRSRSR